jgi:predicted ABC-type ATPase
MARPILWVIAGPNGAGKTTFWTEQLSRFTRAEFINADDLARAQFGRPAATESESAWGQAAAEARRHALMAARTGFVMESTFSHPSKLDLLADAAAQGYAVRVFHLHLEDASIAVERVGFRVADGGHPVPEGRIRARFDRNPALIREAVLRADEAWVYDTTAEGRRPALALRLENGVVAERAARLPGWVCRLYLPPTKKAPGSPDAS